MSGSVTLIPLLLYAVWLYIGLLFFTSSMSPTSQVEILSNCQNYFQLLVPSIAIL